ncbi:hypothetical protein Y032_0179g723 [Ancylostoma ceylanicum]|uniref:Uncharacterized protein n=1 Tax=Ancylostoma ceylanicum TaxID=53326 RepID=A0A016ST52_9BILA|nr:hypothetical protein Y032_0179g723 [Ancylostoma ceylanicum]
MSGTSIIGKQWGHRGLLLGPPWANLGTSEGKPEDFWWHIGGLFHLNVHALCAQMPALEPAQAILSDRSLGRGFIRATAGQTSPVGLV